jgi:hypothetical protein
MEKLQAISVERARKRMYHGGIVRHAINERCFIFCIGKDQQKISDFLTRALSKELAFKTLQGSYYGNPELSFIANIKDYERILPFLNEQESISNQYDARDRPRATSKFIATGETIRMDRLIPIDEADMPKYNSSKDGQYCTCVRR